MANKFSFSVDVDLTKRLSVMKTEFNRRVVRSAVFAGIKVYRERAANLAPVYKGPPKKYKSGKPVIPGTLRDSIYNVWVADKSGEMKQTYTVSWNHPKAGHGHWIEYGHWYRKTEGGPALKWVPPHSFIRAAEDCIPRVFQVARERAYQRFDELLPLLDKEGNLPEFKPEAGS